MKSGSSGNIDFGSNDETDDSDPNEEEPTTDVSADESETDSNDAQTTSTESVNTESTGSQASDYPYFVRRNNVGDERENRIEIYLRNAVVEKEKEYRNALADALNASDVSKTDAREFALLYAYNHPEKVAELLREDGFDAV